MIAAGGADESDPHGPTVDRILANLKILAMVPRGGKLCQRQGQLCLEPHDTLQPVRRWMLCDSRDVALCHVRSTVSGAIQLSNDLLQQYNAHSASDSSNDKTAAPMLPLWMLQRLTRDMQACESGFKNLIATYVTDSLMVANLEVQAERLKEHERDVVRVLAHICVGGYGHTVGVVGAMPGKPSS